jgi:hypothetical protein
MPFVFYKNNERLPSFGQAFIDEATPIGIARQIKLQVRNETEGNALAIDWQLTDKDGKPIPTVKLLIYPTSLPLNESAEMVIEHTPDREKGAEIAISAVAKVV